MRRAQVIVEVKLSHVIYIGPKNSGKKNKLAHTWGKNLRVYHVDPAEMSKREWHKKAVTKKPATANKIYKGELSMRLLLDRLFPGATYENNARPCWLVNPKTGATMELDRYYPELALAFEFQGDQHYEFSPKFHLDISDFHAQTKRDDAKRQACKDKRVFLCYVHQSDLTFAGIETLINHIERSRAAGKWWHNKGEVVRTHVKRFKPRKHRRRSKEQYAQRSGVIGSDDMVKR